MNYCPLCDESSTFEEYNGRPRARCRFCRSLERHRLVWLFFITELRLFDGTPRAILEVAPNGILQNVMQEARNIEYHSIDLEYEAQQRMDVQAMSFADAAFDGLYAIHVLEHVEDDVRALREIHRVLKPGGWALLQVPLNNGLTIEQIAGVVTEEQRRLVYGQRDHLRFYGRLDYRDRLQAQGFAVHVHPLARSLGAETCQHYGLQIQEDLYFCRKPPVTPDGLQT